MNFYNDNDPRNVAWLRELVKTGLIPPGVVDGRSIKEIRPDELADYTQCHFFAGIGGWSLALQLAGWPADLPVWTGSCPCQPFSSAGKGRGEDDPRHLWPDFRALIRQCRPPVVFGEQVASKAGREWLAGVFADLEGMAYRRAGADLCAAGVGAPHIRQRLFWAADRSLGLADPGSSGGDGWPSVRDQPVCQLGDEGSGMADAQSAERRPDHRLCRTQGRDGILQREEGPDGTGGRRGPGGVADPEDADGWPQQQTEGEGRGWGGPPGDGADGGVGYPVRPRLEGLPGTGDERGEPGRLPEDPARTTPPPGIARPWERFDLIPCRDGKARRVESGTFPLAHGIPARMGRLRGYGNAIVPQVAAEFVAAYREACRSAGALTR